MFDIKEPPPAPPNRSMKNGMFGIMGEETDESKRIGKEYRRNLEVYGQMLKTLPDKKKGNTDG